jgi:thymidylate kinase
VTSGLRPVVAAFEGPCCAGKTTLAHRLTESVHDLTVVFIPCYADHVGGGRYLPAQEAKTVLEREEALRQLLAVEAARLARARQGMDVILADRSVHTLLAHSYALEVMTGIGFLAPSVRLLRTSAIPAWPDLVLYLDLPQHAVATRNRGKFPAGSIYTDPQFNAAVRSYFLRLAGQNAPRVAWLDAMLDQAGLARQAETRLRQMVSLRDTQGAI